MGIMKKKTETTIVLGLYMGTRENKMETSPLERSPSFSSFKSQCASRCAPKRTWNEIVPLEAERSE